MKINFEVEINEEEIKQNLNGGYSVTDGVKNQIRNDIISTILSKMDIKTYSDELTTQYARDVYNKIGTLSKEKVLEYLSDEKITELVQSKVKWQMDSFIEKNIYDMFNKMKDEFVFMRKEDFDNEIENAKE